VTVTRRLLATLDTLSYGMALASGILFLIASFYITIDVVGRKFVGVSSALTDEMGGYALALGGMWALAYTLRTGGHVRIDVLLPRFPRALRETLSYAAMATMAFFAAIVAVYVWLLAADSYAADARAMSFLRTPLYLPQGLMALGLSVLSVEAIVILLIGVLESIAGGRLVDLAIDERGEEIPVPVGTPPAL
jgi:TRAP-type C4-dicarboxylate transport system permease small subunit